MRANETILDWTGLDRFDPLNSSSFRTSPTDTDPSLGEDALRAGSVTDSTCIRLALLLIH